MKRGVLLGTAVLLAGCGGGVAAVTPTVVVGTPTVVAVSLTVTLSGQPSRSFGGGHWRVCDSGTVRNSSSILARDVRVVVTYYNHGSVDGHTSRDDAGGNGGALGDIAPGASHDFTVCGYANNEPDRDVVEATLAP